MGLEGGEGRDQPIWFDPLKMEKNINFIEPVSSSFRLGKILDFCVTPARMRTRKTIGQRPKLGVFEPLPPSSSVMAENLLRSHPELQPLVLSNIRAIDVVIGSGADRKSVV